MFLRLKFFILYVTEILNFYRLFILDFYLEIIYVYFDIIL